VNIIVCLKQIIDPLAPAREFRVDNEKKEAVRGAAALVTNIFCENAVEMAVQCKEQLGAAKITALSFGTTDAEDSLRKALAMKADAAALVLNDGASNPDPFAVAQVLAAAIQKLGAFDLVLTGRESGDWGVGQTGALLAELLNVPYVGFVDKIESADGQSSGKLKLKRQTDNGFDVVEAAPPLVVSITNDEHNVPRIPKVRDIMMAGRTPIQKFTLDELGVDSTTIRAGGDYYAVADLSIPVKEVQCEFIAGDSLEQKVEQLAQRILEVTRAL
jgi:electron transfer flavoprotein beta subunit